MDVFTCDHCALTLPQTVIALDLYLAYLRTAFNTCYYCAVVTDHIEELQRKCVKHVRKPLSKSLLQEIKAAEAQKTEPKAEDENADEREREKEKEPTPKDKSENRDWKRNGASWCDACLSDSADVYSCR